MNANAKESQNFSAVGCCVAAIAQRFFCPTAIATRGLPQNPALGGDSRDSMFLTAGQAVSHRSIHPHPSSHAAPMRHMQSEHFFSYDSDTTVGTIGTKSATKSLFLATAVFRLSATISNTTVKPGILRTDQEDQDQIQMAPFSRPTSCPQSEHRRKLAQSCGRNKLAARNRSVLPRRRRQIQITCFSRPFFDPSRNTAPSWPKATVGTIATP